MSKQTIPNHVYDGDTLVHRRRTGLNLVGFRKKIGLLKNYKFRASDLLYENIGERNSLTFFKKFRHFFFFFLIFCTVYFGRHLIPTE